MKKIKNLKNLTIASLLCTSVCSIIPVVANATVKPQLKSNSNFATRQAYIDFSGTSKPSPSGFLQTKINAFNSQKTSTPKTSTSKISLPKGNVDKVKKFFESLSTTSQSSKKSPILISSGSSIVKNAKDKLNKSVEKSSKTNSKSPIITATKKVSDLKKLFEK